MIAEAVVGVGEKGRRSSVLTILAARTKIPQFGRQLKYVTLNIQNCREARDCVSTHRHAYSLYNTVIPRFFSLALCLQRLSWNNRPHWDTKKKNAYPATVPSFFPVGVSSSIPAQIPVLN